MNIVVLDNEELAPGTDFPALDAAKYGWIQYPRLKSEDIVPTCWRSDVIISLNTPLDGAWFDELKMLRMLVVGQSAEKLCDPAPLEARGVQLLVIDDVDWAHSTQAEQGCQRIVDAVNALLKSQAAS